MKKKLYKLFLFILIILNSVSACYQAKPTINITKTIEPDDPYPLTKSSTSPTGITNLRETDPVLKTTTLPPWKSDSTQTITQEISQNSASETETLIKALADENCLLPCFLGINPGITLIDEARLKIEKMGGKLHSIRKNFDQGDPFQIHRFNIDIDIPPFLVQQRIIIYVFNGVVVRLDVGVWSSGEDLFYDNWSRYSTPTLLKQYGIPDELQVSVTDIGYYIGGTSWVLYNEYGIYLMNVSKNQQENIICPGFQMGRTTRLFFVVFDNQYSDVLDEFSNIDGISAYMFIDGKLKINSETTESIDTKLDLEMSEIYDQIVNNPNICFILEDFEY